VEYRFRGAKSFRRALARLSPEKKRLAAASVKIFKQNPFDPRLRPSTPELPLLNQAHCLDTVALPELCQQ
jgi:hypothetical protein